MEIKNIIFDFGGVVMDWDPRYLYKDIFNDTDEMEYFLTEVCTLEWNATLDEGKSFSDGVAELLPKFPQYKKEIKLYHTNWIKMIAGEIKKNTSLIPLVKENYRLFGLTNWSAETFPLVFHDYPFFKELEGIVVSGEEKVIKPNPKIYQILLSRYNINAEESLFIDDNKDNIEAAQKLGFQTIHLAEKVDLKHEFEKRNLI
ncbi:HAD family hydrolase [Sediminitomix flava]|uniref:2-haloacid dehalogenase n=1 Tax=Sediminitomix flava TaxID=379075 RepID=A0A315ZCE8_SEDFL|nr:HAD family phosphatase [Sediminitomix flava]PWJ42773.1 2-haloacid dehalogenase [Sediminitomix flava]